MEIKTISRTISGNNYDNFSATAELDESDGLPEAFKRLDSSLRKAMKEVYENQEIIDIPF